MLIHKIDNTTFGNEPPTLPQWTGPPHTIVHVQAILFASLAASLLSAFLAILGKQWLNQYASTNMRGSTIERSQNRQRKLDGIVTWYFDYMLESLPLMLQAALLLLGCALSHYLWEISITVASVILGVTSFSVIFYISIVAAGAASENCPYQTPGSRILHYLASLAHTARNRLHGAPPIIGWGLARETTALDLRCVLWILQASLDKTVRLSTLKYLATMTIFADFDPTLVIHCFNALVDCVNVTDYTVVLLQDAEDFAVASALCFFNTASRLLATDPTSSVLVGVRRDYLNVFPARTDFYGHRFYHTMNAIHCLFVRRRERLFMEWSGYQPSTHEHIPFVRGMVDIARAGYRKSQHRKQKVPRWVLRFAFHCLSLDPQPPTPIVADCLSIIAIDLGCDMKGIGVMPPEYRCVCI